VTKRDVELFAPDINLIVVADIWIGGQRIVQKCCIARPGPSASSKQRHFVIQDRSPVAHIVRKAAVLIDAGVTQA
jgi:hypothetical protein